MDINTITRGDLQFISTPHLKVGDVVLDQGALLRLTDHAVHTDPDTHIQIHTFGTEAVDASGWKHAKRELAGWTVRGDHFHIWARVKR